jgi:hypothetical protein
MKLKNAVRVQNLLRQWRADLICLQEPKLEFISSNVVRSCLQEPKLEFISSNVVRSLWGYQHMDWCYLTTRRASSSILLKKLYYLRLRQGGEDKLQWVPSRGMFDVRSFPITS